MISLKGPFSAHLRRAWVGVLGCVAASAVAAPQNSANYSATSDTMDAGGRRSTSANYTNDGSVGGIVGISTVAAPAAMVKHGFIGQLYEVTAFQISSTPTTVNEGETRLLSGAQVLDDLTRLAIPATSIAWSVQSGPLVSINSSGLATAGPVFQSTAATAQGIYLGQTGTLGLTVLDTIPGNFGQNNPPSAPNVDSWPTASAIDYGQTLASSTLSGGSASVAGIFTFTSPSTAPAVGTALQAVTFTPADTANYTTVSGNVSVTVNKLTPEVPTWPAATVIALGQTLASSTLSGGSASVAGNFTFTNSSTAPAIGTASQAVTFTPTDSATYNSVSGNASVTVKKALLFSGYALTTVNKVVSISTAKILARASDPNGGTVALTQVFGPSAQGGTVSRTSTVNYTPGTSFTGTDSFQVELTSSTGVKLRGTITVTVTDSVISQSLSQLTPRDGMVDLVFRGIPGRSYTIQRSSNLMTWTNLATIQAAADGKISYTDTTPLQPNGYYRTAN